MFVWLVVYSVDGTYSYLDGNLCFSHRACYEP